MSITAAEAIKLEDVDMEAVTSGLARFEQEAEKAATERDKAIAQIGVEVHQALKAAMEQFGKASHAGGH